MEGMQAVFKKVYWGISAFEATGTLQLNFDNAGFFQVRSSPSSIIIGRTELLRPHGDTWKGKSQPQKHGKG